MSGPYSAGMPVGDTSSFVGRVDALAEVCTELRAGRSVVVTGPRRFGVSSLLQRLVARPPAGLLLCRLDLAGRLDLGAGLWPLLGRHIARALTLAGPPPSRRADGQRVFAAWLEALSRRQRARGRVFALAFDHADPSDPRCAGLRALSVPVVWGAPRGAAPTALHTVALGPLGADGLADLRALAPELVWSEEGAQTLELASGGHPVLAQQLCAVLWEQSAGRGRVDASEVNEAIEEALRRSRRALDGWWDDTTPAERAAVRAGGWPPGHAWRRAARERAGSGGEMDPTDDPIPGATDLPEPGLALDDSLTDPGALPSDPEPADAREESLVDEAQPDEAQPDEVPAVDAAADQAGVASVSRGTTAVDAVEDEDSAAEPDGGEGEDAAAGDPATDDTGAGDVAVGQADEDDTADEGPVDELDAGVQGAADEEPADEEPADEGPADDPAERELAGEEPGDEEPAGPSAEQAPEEAGEPVDGAPRDALEAAGLARLAAMEAQLTAARKRADEAGADAEAGAELLHWREQELSSARETIALLRQQVAQGGEQITLLKQQLAQRDEQLTRREQELERRQALLARSERGHAELASELRKAEEEVQRGQAAAELGRAELEGRLQSRIEEAHRETEEARRELASGREEVARQTQRAQRAEQRVSQLEQSVASGRTRIEQLTKNLERERIEKASASRPFREELAEAQRQHSALEEELTAARVRISELEGAVAGAEEAAAAARATVEDERAKAVEASDRAQREAREVADRLRATQKKLARAEEQAARDKERMGGELTRLRSDNAELSGAAAFALDKLIGVTGRHRSLLLMVLLLGGAGIGLQIHEHQTGTLLGQPVRTPAQTPIAPVGSETPTEDPAPSTAPEPADSDLAPFDESEFQRDETDRLLAPGRWLVEGAVEPSRDASELDPSCTGRIGAAPSAPLLVTERVTLALKVQGEADLSLALSAEDGQIWCNAALSERLPAPLVSAILEPGLYQVHVGVEDNAESPVPFTLTAASTALAEEP